MFTEKFGRFVCDGDTISCEVDGFKITARIEHDDDSGTPWDRDCNYGPVSDWTYGRDRKRPGQRILSQDHGHYRFYDFQEAVAIARHDGWGSHGDEGLTAGAKAARAAEEDYKVLKAWCNDEWHYVGVVLSVSRKGIVLDEYAASLWGIECNYPGSDNSYLSEVASELLEEAIEVGNAALKEFIDSAD